MISAHCPTLSEPHGIQEVGGSIPLNSTSPERSIRWSPWWLPLFL